MSTPKPTRRKSLGRICYESMASEFDVLNLTLWRDVPAATRERYERLARAVERAVLRRTYRNSNR